MLLIYVFRAGHLVLDSQLVFSSLGKTHLPLSAFLSYAHTKQCIPDFKGFTKDDVIWAVFILIYMCLYGYNICVCLCAYLSAYLPVYIWFGSVRLPMCVCLCTCMCLCMCASVNIWSVSLLMYVYVHVWVRLCVFVYVWCICISVFVYMSMYVWVCVCMRHMCLYECVYVCVYRPVVDAVCHYSAWHLR